MAGHVGPRQFEEVANVVGVGAALDRTADDLKLLTHVGFAICGHGHDGELYPLKRIQGPLQRDGVRAARPSREVPVAGEKAATVGA